MKRWLFRRSHAGPADTETVIVNGFDFWEALREAQTHGRSWIPNGSYGSGSTFTDPTFEVWFENDLGQWMTYAIPKPSLSYAWTVDFMPSFESVAQGNQHSHLTVGGNGDLLYAARISDVLGMHGEVIKAQWIYEFSGSDHVHEFMTVTSGRVHGLEGGYHYLQPAGFTEGGEFRLTEFSICDPCSHTHASPPHSAYNEHALISELELWNPGHILKTDQVSERWEV